MPFTVHAGNHIVEQGEIAGGRGGPDMEPASATGVAIRFLELPHADDPVIAYGGTDETGIEYHARTGRKSNDVDVLNEVAGNSGAGAMVKMDTRHRYAVGIIDGIADCIVGHDQPIIRCPCLAGHVDPVRGPEHQVVLDGQLVIIGTLSSARGSFLGRQGRGASGEYGVKNPVIVKIARDQGIKAYTPSVHAHDTVLHRVVRGACACAQAPDPYTGPLARPAVVLQVLDGQVPAAGIVVGAIDGDIVGAI